MLTSEEVDLYFSKAKQVLLKEKEMDVRCKEEPLDKFVWKLGGNSFHPVTSLYGWSDILSGRKKDSTPRDKEGYVKVWIELSHETIPDLDLVVELPGPNGLVDDETTKHEEYDDYFYRGAHGDRNHLFDDFLVRNDLVGKLSFEEA